MSDVSAAFKPEIGTVEQDVIQKNLSVKSVVVDFSHRRPSLHIPRRNFSDVLGEKGSNKSRRSLNDVVSKNITLVLENLLKNYESSQLPTHGTGELKKLNELSVGSCIAFYVFYDSFNFKSYINVRNKIYGIIITEASNNLILLLNTPG